MTTRRYRRRKKGRRKRRERREHSRLEFLRERLLVQEHPRVPKLLIEPVLQPPYAPDGVVHVGVPREHEDRGVRAAAQQSLRVGRLGVEDIVVVRDGVNRTWRAPGKLGGDVLEGGSTAVVFVCEAENRVEANLSEDRRRCERGHGGDDKGEETDDDDDDQEHVARRGRQLQRHLERCGGRGLRSMTVVSQRMQASSARERER